MCPETLEQEHPHSRQCDGVAQKIGYRNHTARRISINGTGNKNQVHRNDIVRFRRLRVIGIRAFTLKHGLHLLGEGREREFPFSSVKQSIDKRFTRGLVLDRRSEQRLHFLQSAP